MKEFLYSKRFRNWLIQLAYMAFNLIAITLVALVFSWLFGAKLAFERAFLIVLFIKVMFLETEKELNNGQL